MHDLIDQLERVMPTALSGCVVRTAGMTAAVADFPAPVGALVEIERQSADPLRAEVIGFRDALTVLYPFSALKGVRRGNRVRLVGTSRWLRVGERHSGDGWPVDLRQGAAHGHLCRLRRWQERAVGHDGPLYGRRRERDCFG